MKSDWIWWNPMVHPAGCFEFLTFRRPVVPSEKPAGLDSCREADGSFGAIGKQSLVMTVFFLLLSFFLNRLYFYRSNSSYYSFNMFFLQIVLIQVLTVVVMMMMIIRICTYIHELLLHAVESESVATRWTKWIVVGCRKLCSSKVDGWHIDWVLLSTEAYSLSLPTSLKHYYGFLLDKLFPNFGRAGRSVRASDCHLTGTSCHPGGSFFSVTDEI